MTEVVNGHPLYGLAARERYELLFCWAPLYFLMAENDQVLGILVGQEFLGRETAWGSVARSGGLSQASLHPGGAQPWEFPAWMV